MPSVRRSAIELLELLVSGPQWLSLHVTLRHVPLAPPLPLHEVVSALALSLGRSKPALQCHVLITSLPPLNLRDPPLIARMLASNTVHVGMKLEGLPGRQLYC